MILLLQNGTQRGLATNIMLCVVTYDVRMPPPTYDPLDSAPDSTSYPCPHPQDSRSNVMFVEVHHRGWPYVFVVATTQIPEGSELLLSYGEDY